MYLYHNRHLMVLFYHDERIYTLLRQETQFRDGAHKGLKMSQ